MNTLRTPPIRLIAALALGAGFLTGCHRREPALPIQPAAAVNRPRVPLGSALEVSYVWTVGSTATPVPPGYQAFVHFLDPRGHVLFADDHVPVPPPDRWSPGNTYRYRRTIFVPVLPFVGEARVVMGLYSPKLRKRIALAAEDIGRRAYRVGTIEVVPQTESVFLVYKEGWHDPEVDPANPATERTWTEQNAVVSFKNPRTDVVVYLEAETCLPCFKESPALTVSVGPAATTLPIGSAPLLARLRAKVEDFGSEEWVDLRLRMSGSFVPKKLVPPLNDDDRQLGLLVYHLSVARADEIGTLDGLDVVDLKRLP